MPAVAAILQAEVTATLQWQRADNSRATPRPRSWGVSPAGKSPFPKICACSRQPCGGISLYRKALKKSPSSGERPSLHPRGGRQPPGPAAVASSRFAWALLGIVPTCQNMGREEGNTEVVFVTFVLLFFYSGCSPSIKQLADRGILL